MIGDIRDVRHCVPYDIPWNPVKLDQRNGRACRIGQTRGAVRAIYFLPKGRSHIVETIASKNRTRRRILGMHPRPIEITAPNVLDLPQRLPADAPALALILALRAQGLTPPPALFHRHRAGVERLFEEMASEYLDAHRLSPLEKVLEEERVITSRRSAAPRVISSPDPGHSDPQNGAFPLETGGTALVLLPPRKGDTHP